MSVHAIKGRAVAAWDYLSGRRRAYLITFAPDTPGSRVVLEDLARFCRAHTSTAHPDPQMSARLDGRREVWLRIEQHLQLSEDQVWELFSGQKSAPVRRGLEGTDA